MSIKKTTDRDITATLFSIPLFFALNIFGFVQAKEQGYEKNIKEEPKVEIRKE